MLILFLFSFKYRFNTILQLCNQTIRRATILRNKIVFDKVIYKPYLN